VPYGFSVEGWPEMGGRTEDAATSSDAPALRPRYARFGAALYPQYAHIYAVVTHPLRKRENTRDTRPLRLGPSPWGAVANPL